MLTVFLFEVFPGFLLKFWLRKSVLNARLAKILGMNDIYMKMKITKIIILMAISLV